MSELGSRDSARLSVPVRHSLKHFRLSPTLFYSAMWAQFTSPLNILLHIPHVNWCLVGNWLLNIHPRRLKKEIQTLQLTHITNLTDA